MIKGIIFDFDGVIAESLQIKTDAFAKLYSQYGESVVNKVVDHHEANGGVSRYDKLKFYQKYFLNKKVTKKDLLSLANKFSNLVINEVINSPFVPGVYSYIKKCSKKYKLFISTGTPINEIIQVLKGKNIFHFFDGVFGSPDDKINHINSILFDNNLGSENLIFFGDSDTDYKAAKYHNIKFILRMHKKNKLVFNNYTGLKIDDFRPSSIRKINIK